MKITLDAFKKKAQEVKSEELLKVIAGGSMRAAGCHGFHCGLIP